MEINLILNAGISAVLSAMLATPAKPLPIRAELQKPRQQKLQKAPLIQRKTI